MTHGTGERQRTANDRAFGKKVGCGDRPISPVWAEPTRCPARSPQPVISSEYPPNFERFLLLHDEVRCFRPF